MPWEVEQVVFDEVLACFETKGAKDLAEDALHGGDAPLRRSRCERRRFEQVREATLQRRHLVGIVGMQVDFLGRRAQSDVPRAKTAGP